MQNQTANPTNNNNETVAPLTAIEKRALRKAALLADSKNTKDVLATTIVSLEDDLVEERQYSADLGTDCNRANAAIVKLTNDVKVLTASEKRQARIIALQNEEAAYEDMTLLELGKVAGGGLITGTKDAFNGTARIGSALTDTVVSVANIATDYANRVRIELKATESLDIESAVTKKVAKNQRITSRMTPEQRAEAAKLVAKALEEARNF